MMKSEAGQKDSSASKPTLKPALAQRYLTCSGHGQLSPSVVRALAIASVQVKGLVSFFKQFQPRPGLSPVFLSIKRKQIRLSARGFPWRPCLFAVFTGPKTLGFQQIRR
jgi:hypothetical protein